MTTILNKNGATILKVYLACRGAYMALFAEVTPQIDQVRLIVDGHFDIGCYDAFHQILSQHFEDASRIVVDFAQASYLDSSALGMLLLLREKMGEQPQKFVSFENAHGPILHALEVAQFEQLFRIDATPQSQVTS